MLSKARQVKVHSDHAALYAVSSKQKHSRKLDGDVVTVHPDQTPEATYSVSAKQKKSRAKKSADDVEQSKTDEDHPDPAALYAESSKKKHKRKKKDKSKGDITYADLDLPPTGSEQQPKRMPAEEMIQYASIQIPEK
ncbi:uncharacterized protein [Ptychodera flava]|uniref:uncharacterized protein n=1 Tax=Ptychodera flava TaxID=63121 RepID=UPI00396A8C6C